MSYPAPPVEPTTPMAVPPAPRRKRRLVLLTLAAIGLFGLGVAVGAAATGGGGTTPTASTSAVKAPATDAAPVVVVTTPARPPAKLTANDFKIAVKVLEKECFGSAGCNVTFRIDPSYRGPNLPPDKAYEVVYEVRGGEDPLRNRFKITGGDTVTYDEEEFIQTKSAGAVLTAVVVEINEL